MLVNDVEQALAAASRMIQARAALQILLGDRYLGVVKGWMDHIKEKMRQTGKEPLDVFRVMSIQERDQLILLIMLSATLEVIEEQSNALVESKIN